MPAPGEIKLLFLFLGKQRNNMKININICWHGNIHVWFVEKQKIFWQISWGIRNPLESRYSCTYLPILSVRWQMNKKGRRRGKAAVVVIVIRDEINRIEFLGFIVTLMVIYILYLANMYLFFATEPRKHKKVMVSVICRPFGRLVGWWCLWVDLHLSRWLPE